MLRSFDNRNEIHRTLQDFHTKTKSMINKARDDPFTFCYSKTNINNTTCSEAKFRCPNDRQLIEWTTPTEFSVKKFNEK